MKRHDFMNNPFMKVMNWAYDVLVMSLLFALTNLPLVFCALFLAIDVRNLPFFLVALLPFGSASLAGLAVVNDFISKKGIAPAKDYARYLIKYFARGLAYWVPTLLVVIILVTDIVWNVMNPALGRFLMPLLVILLLAVLGLVVNLLYLQVRNPDATKRAVWRLSVYYLAKRWYIALVNAVLVTAVPMLMIIKPQFGMVITPALLLLLIYLNCEFLGKAHLWHKRPKEVD